MHVRYLELKGAGKNRYGPGRLEQISNPLGDVTLLTDPALVLDVGYCKTLRTFWCSHLVAKLLEFALAPTRLIVMY